MFDFFKRRAPTKVGANDFEVLLAERAGRWYSACLRITKSPSLAEDALQDALIKAWGARAQFAGRAALDTWVHTIAVRCALDQLRAHKLLGVESVDEPMSELQKNSPHQELHLQQFDQQLARAMTRLTAQERVCFELKHREEWSLIEISLALELSLNATKQALFRAVRKLRVALPHWQGIPND